MKKNYKLMKTAVIFCLFVLNFSFALEIPIEYQVPDPDVSNSFYILGGRTVFTRTRCPVADVIKPEFQVKKPYYGQMLLGGKSYLFALDKNNSDFYNELYFDLNNNNDLTDDDILIGTRIENEKSRIIRIKFPHLEIYNSKLIVFLIISFLTSSPFRFLLILRFPNL